MIQRYIPLLTLFLFFSPIFKRLLKKLLSHPQSLSLLLEFISRTCKTLCYSNNMGLKRIYTFFFLLFFSIDTLVKLTNLINPFVFFFGFIFTFFLSSYEIHCSHRTDFFFLFLFLFINSYFSLSLVHSFTHFLTPSIVPYFLSL